MSDEAPRPEPLPRPNQIEGLTPDQVVAVVWRLAMEISVLRDRLHSHELLLEQHGLLSPEAVDDYRPSPDQAARRQSERTTLIEKIISDLS